MNTSTSDSQETVLEKTSGRGEKPEFLSEQILTYLGNKRLLLPNIGKAVRLVRRELSKKKLNIFDAFSGSGIVSRFFKQYSRNLYVNDLEAYSHCLNSCYLTNRSNVDMQELETILAETKQKIEDNLHGGFIRELYAPKNEECIKPRERVFYTIRNAEYLDTACQEIGRLPEKYRPFLLAPLLYGASVHANTAGVFKGFYKNRKKTGQFGGIGKNALFRIKGNIELQMPVFSKYECNCEIYQKDALDAAREIPEELDLAYLDPPYNQHPYGSNYFMLNLLMDYKRPKCISRVSGIPDNWKRSPYNLRNEAQNALFRLIDELKAKYVLISYNSEGFVKYDAITSYLESLGQLTTMAITYNTFKACRNLNSRNIHVKEYLFLLKKK